MPEEKKGLWATLKDRWAKFKTAGKPKDKPERTVDTSRTSARPVRPQMNEQQRRATQSARTRSKRPRERKATRSNGR